MHSWFWHPVMAVLHSPPQFEIDYLYLLLLSPNLALLTGSNAWEVNYFFVGKRKSLWGILKIVHRVGFSGRTFIRLTGWEKTKIKKPLDKVFCFTPEHTSTFSVLYGEIKENISVYLFLYEEIEASPKDFTIFHQHHHVISQMEGKQRSRALVRITLARKRV